jgi:CMP-N-acetylneuraminic acid synthetase
MRGTPDALALIPARGGSKGIPGKNLLEVGGVPLIGRCIRAALSSTRIKRVVVTTDDKTIADVALNYGSEVIRRPKQLAEDDTSSELALLHALDELEATQPLEPHIAFLQCTAPFTTGDQIDKVLKALDIPGINSSLSVVPFHGFIWLQNGKGVNHDPTKKRLRRQELEPSFLENGAIYAMKTREFRETHNRFCAKCLPVKVEPLGPEIDTPSDLAVCRALAQAAPQ